MSLWHLILQNLARNKRSLTFASIGLVIGVATFVFFIALGEGVKQVVLEKIFVIRQLEVVPRTYDLGLTQAAPERLNPDAVETLRDIDGVIEVFPKMKFTFPSWATGGKAVLGKDFRAEVIADGVPPAIVRTELGEDGDAFRDWEADFTCRGEGEGEAVGCPMGRRCIDGRCTKVGCNPEVPEHLSQCTGQTYCAEDTRTCEIPIPAIANPALLAVYNSSLTTALEAGDGATLPKLTEDALVGFRFNVEFGKSYLGDAAQGEPFKRQVELVGFSDKAIQVGFTLPIQYVKRFNARFTGEDVRDEFHSVIVVAESNEAVAPIAADIKKLGYELDAKHAEAERVALVINIVTLIFSLISLLIVTISAINIAQTFLMMIAERRREIGILRALGATRGDIRWVILGEATLLGVFGGALGVGLGFGASKLIDFVSQQFVPDFPFKPTSYFVFEPWLIIGAIFLAVLFCVLGAFAPARRAANMEPAQAFSTQ